MQKTFEDKRHPTVSSDRGVPQNVPAVLLQQKIS